MDTESWGRFFQKLHWLMEFRRYLNAITTNFDSIGSHSPFVVLQR